LAIVAVVGLTSCRGDGSAALSVMVLVFAFTVILAARFRDV
jgi:hypothetical protein